MPSWINLVVPILMSVASAFVTASFMTGKNVEKLQIMDDMLKQNAEVLQSVLERVAKLEGRNDAK